MRNPLHRVSRRGWLAALAGPWLSSPITSLHAASARGAAELSPGVAPPLLASAYTGQVDPALCLVSEKYDGVRALWDGRTLRHRSGRPVSAPSSFLKNLPAVGLDGELWLGRGRFDEVSALVRRTEAHDPEWAAVRYMLFEMPDAGGTFAERARRIEEVVARSGPSASLVAVAQERVADRAALQRRLRTVVAGGGEGLVLHVASAPVAHGRNDVLMKLKPHLDAEAVVVGYRHGTGKYANDIGALDVRTDDGRRFFVGSGLTDALRHAPPALGETITFRYRDLTSSGLPRFATYVRRHDAL